MSTLVNTQKEIKNLKTFSTATDTVSSASIAITAIGPDIAEVVNVNELAELVWDL